MGVSKAIVPFRKVQIKKQPLCQRYTKGKPLIICQPRFVVADNFQKFMTNQTCS